MVTARTIECPQRLSLLFPLSDRERPRGATRPRVIGILDLPVTCPNAPVLRVFPWSLAAPGSTRPELLGVSRAFPATVGWWCFASPTRYPNLTSSPMSPSRHRLFPHSYGRCSSPSALGPKRGCNPSRAVPRTGCVASATRVDGIRLRDAESGAQAYPDSPQNRRQDRERVLSKGSCPTLSKASTVFQKTFIYPPIDTI